MIQNKESDGKESDTTKKVMHYLCKYTFVALQLSTGTFLLQKLSINPTLSAIFSFGNGDDNEIK